MHTDDTLEYDFAAMRLRKENWERVRANITARTYVAFTELSTSGHLTVHLDLPSGTTAKRDKIKSKLDSQFSNTIFHRCVNPERYPKKKQASLQPA